MRENELENEYKLVDDENFYLVEAYKTLRTNLEYSIIGKNNKVIIVTSSVSQEGKSHITANLGVFLSHIGYKVLLMDCDFRKPKLNKFFNLSSRVGITNILFKKTELICAINPVDTLLHVLCTGPLPPNSVEILNSKQMKALIKTVSTKYDYILIDTPPSAYLSDASILVPNSTGVLFVIKYSSTPTDVIKQAITNLEKANANIIGTIISQITKKYTRYNKYDINYYVNNKTTSNMKKP